MRKTKQKLKHSIKHPKKYIFFVILIFLLTHYLGLLIASQYFDFSKHQAKPLPNNIERPQQKNFDLIVYLVISLIVISAIFLLLVKFKLNLILKLWFAFAYYYLIQISLITLINLVFKSRFNNIISIVLAILLTLLRFKFKTSNFILIPEILLYGAFPAIFMPLLNIHSIMLLMIIVSVYDYISVRKAKTMIKLAHYQLNQGLFSGIRIIYDSKRLKSNNKQIKEVVNESKQVSNKKPSLIALGGGDIAFSLLFASVLLKYNLILALLSPLFSSLAILYIFFNQKHRSYPAMPYITFSLIILYFLALIL